MTRIALTAVASFLLLASPASAATADADVRIRGGVRLGPVTFTGSPGEANRLTISMHRGELVFRDSANVVRARGDCDQLTRHSARCPFTEDIAQARLGDGDDRADVRTGLVEVLGGSGEDLLRGSGGIDRLSGGTGGDRLEGRGGRDDLTGGPGHDRLFGGTGDDVLVDGETDRQAARDVFKGGSSTDTAGADRGDVLSYAKRRRGLRVDLGRRRTNTEDRILGIESLVGGRGNDRLTGDRDDNNLEGGPGADVLRGGRGRDIPMGGGGNDRVYGGDQDDVVWGDAGRDRLFGERGDDTVISLEERGGARADKVACGTGRDSARTDGEDTLTAACETVVAFSNGIFVTPFPAIDADSADFAVRCSGGTGPQGCAGTISLRAPDGRSFGSARFTVGADRAARVSVPLDAQAVAALRAGTVVRVDLVSDAPPGLEEPGGYRALMRA